MTALKNEWSMSVQIAFRSRKVFGAFEKRTPGRLTPTPFKKPWIPPLVLSK